MYSAATKVAYSLARNFGLHIVRIRCSMMPEVRKIKVLTQWCNLPSHEG